MQESIQQLYSEVFAASTILPILLTLMPRGWSNEVKKLTSFLAAIILTLLVATQNADFASLNFHSVPALIPHLAIVVIVSSQIYDKVISPATTLVARKTPLKFLDRSNRTSI